MKLRSSLRLQQLLFTLLLTAGSFFSGIAFAQQDAAVYFKSAQQQPISAKVVGVSGSSLMVRDPYGEHGIALSQILEVKMAEPPEVQAAMTAFQAKDYQKAMSAARAVVDKYAGLPASWAIAMTSLIGDINLAQGDMAKASAAYDAFAKAYPDNGSADLGRARVAVAKKDYDTASRTAEKISADALKNLNVTQAKSQLYGQAFLVLGQIKEARGDYQG